MKIPINCPICHRIMLTDFKEENYIQKSCTLYVDHKILLNSRNGEEIIGARILLDINSMSWAVWDFYSINRLSILTLLNKYSIVGSELTLPFFEPDFSNYPKLLQKLKTYLTFI